ncbi:N5-glutamine methyltransferase family protein [Glutamicibacter protophormiae]|uniref:N5-glutamine methyltransferase family protein n=1 Tax=Glutamicibacter protophormiae TaxID=37930 RepID=UPI003A8E820A
MGDELPPGHAARLSRLSAALQTLVDKPDENATSTFFALWWLAAGHRVSAVAAKRARPPALDRRGLEQLDDLINRRLSGEPLAHITARQWFSGLEMLVGPEALVPRRETELLTTTGIELARAIVAARGQVNVADACTGCGNVALSIAAHVPLAHVFAADLSEASIALATLNAEHLGLSHRVEFTAGDLVEPFFPHAGRIDVLTCNPPYISTAKVGDMATEISEHEPSMAFDGGPLGVNLLLRLIEDAPKVLAHGGWLTFEVGQGQGPGFMRRLVRNDNYSVVRSVEDSDATVRVICARVRRADAGQGRKSPLS